MTTLNTSDYKVVHQVTAGTDLRDLFENQFGDHHAAVLAPGTYTVSGGYINYPWHNTHIFADESSYMDGALTPKPGGSLVKIRAGLWVLGGQLLRITGVDLLTPPDLANLYTFGASVFMTDTQFRHLQGDASPWAGGGGAISSYFSEISIESTLRHSDIDHTYETVSGNPIKMKDSGFLRMAASTNGWKPRIFHAKGPAIVIAGTGSYLHDLDIFGPGKGVAGTVGVEVFRGGGHAYMLKSLGSPLIQNCEVGVSAHSGGKFSLLTMPKMPLDIKFCKWGMVHNNVGSMAVSNRDSVRFTSVDHPWAPSQEGIAFG